MRYDPRNWYWLVAGVNTPYSSAAAAYVPAQDETYQAWLGAGGAATKIDSEASLREVLSEQYPQGWAGVTRWTPLDFMARLTPLESAMIATAAQKNASVLLFLLTLSGASYIDASDPRTQQGVQLMVAGGLLTAERAAEIMNPASTPPSAVALDVAHMTLVRR